MLGKPGYYFFVVCAKAAKRSWNQLLNTPFESRPWLV